MKYSVIIPLYNRQDTIESCIDSVLNQTYKDYEIIIVDDGSTDDSSKIADNYASRFENIKVIHKENGGLSSARNTGVEIACGEYILFLDSDDLWEETLLESVYPYPSDLTIFGYVIEYEKKSFRKKFSINGYSDVQKILLKAEQVGAFNVAWNKVYKADIIKNLVFKDYMPCEDIIFNCEYYHYVKTSAIVDKVLYRYLRKEDVSLATKYNKDLSENIKVANSARENLYSALNIDEKISQQILARKKVGYAFSQVPNIFRKNNGLKIKEKYRELKKIIKDKELKKDISKFKVKGFNHKFFKFNVKLNNGVIAYISYSFLFFIRNNMTKLYKKLRRK